MEETLFETLSLSPELTRAVQDMNYTSATGIQAQAIPLLLEGHDLIGRSSTGTGKTAAFGIPAVESVEGDNKRAQVLILSPTRELAMQIATEMRKFAKYKPGVSVAVVYGGASMELQIRQLRTANIVVGTPGRIMDHLRRRTLKLDQIKTAVLDEADEMLNMGFYEDIQSILQQIPQEHQTVLFSATMPPAILKITEEFLKEPMSVDIKTGQRTIATTEQFYYQVPQSRKMDSINLLLQRYEPKRSVVFCNTKAMVDELVGYLTERGFKAAGLHGDMKQASRTQVMQSFRDSKIGILVATDVAARGIDVDDIEAVFNFDIPQEFEYYIHRIGRTGRAGKMGVSHTLVCNQKQLAAIKQLQRFINAEIKPAPIPTPEDIQMKKQEKFSASVGKILEQGQFENWSGQIDALCTEHGHSLHDIACALAQMLSIKDKKLVPVVKGPVASGRSGGHDGKRVLLEADIGRSERIAPNFIVGAIVDATGLPSRAVGKIDIYDNHTLVEMFENDALTVLAEMSACKIKGQDVHFTLSSVKPYNAIRHSESDRTARTAEHSAHRDGKLPRTSYNRRERPRFDKHRKKGYDS